MTRRHALLIALGLVLAFKSGMAFDRWLHRPIHAGGFTVEGVIPTQESPAPPPAIIHGFTPPRFCFSDGTRSVCEDETPKAGAGAEVKPNTKLPLKPASEALCRQLFPFSHGCQWEI